jgi:hypothetical protein
MLEFHPNRAHPSSLWGAAISITWRASDGPLPPGQPSNNPDLFQQAFGPHNHEIVNGFYEIWFPIRKELFALIKQRIEEPGATPRDSIRAIIKRFSKEVAPYNRRFLEMCLKEYSDYLKGLLAKPI